MTAPLQTDFQTADPAAIADIKGRVALFLAEDGAMDPLARRVDALTGGAVKRLAAGDAFAKAGPGSGETLAWPSGMAAEALLVVKLARRPSPEQARKAGAAIAGFNAKAFEHVGPFPGGVPEAKNGIVHRVANLVYALRDPFRGQVVHCRFCGAE